MSRLEDFIAKHPRAYNLADHLFPEKLKSQIRAAVMHTTYPLPEPVTGKINGLEARFWINNTSDWYRIVRKDFEDDFARDLITCIQPNDVFIDIGSAQGLYAIIAAKAGADVYAIRSDPVSLQSITANLALNPEIKDQVQVLSVALGDQKRKMTLYFDHRGTYAPSLVRTIRGLGQSMEIELVSLDELLMRNVVKQPDIVKIDVEGAEHLVLAGMAESLRCAERPKHLFIEIHPQYLPKFGVNRADVIRQITALGYVAYANPTKHRDKTLSHFVPA